MWADFGSDNEEENKDRQSNKEEEEGGDDWGDFGDFTPAVTTQ